MKISCAAYSFRNALTRGKMTLEDFIRKGWELGLDGVELTSYYFTTTEDEYVFKLKRVLLSYGLDVSAIGVGNRFTLPDVKAREKEVMKVKRWIEVAAKIGAPVVRVFAGDVPEGYGEEEAFAWVVDALKECVNYARRYGVVVALENHGGITATAEGVLKILRAVDSEWMGVNLDTGNYRLNRYEEIRKTAPYAVHVHAKFLKVGPEGNDEILDYARIVDVLYKTGYKGYLSIEYEGKESAESAVPRAVRFLKGLLKRT